MAKITHADLLADMNAVRRAIVTRFPWLIHVTPVEALADIRIHGLQPLADAAAPADVMRTIGNGSMVFFYPLGINQAAPPVSHKHGQSTFSGDFATLAIRSCCIPSRVDIDWSFNPADVQSLIDWTGQSTIESVVADLIRRQGSLVTYDVVIPEKLRVFSVGDPPTNPENWKCLTHVQNGYGVFHKPKQVV